MMKQRSSKRRFPSERDAQLIEQTRDTIKEAKGLLSKPAPDTFLGRQTHEMFPKEEADQLV
jgi:hypothetical protein